MYKDKHYHNLHKCAGPSFTIAVLTTKIWTRLLSVNVKHKVYVEIAKIVGEVRTANSLVSRTGS